MSDNKKDEYLELYVKETLNKIKKNVFMTIKIDEEKEVIADKKMYQVLLELVNGNFKNIQKKDQGSLIYTLLPLSDEKEHEKVRNTLVSYYTALYFDNVQLYRKLVDEGISLNAFGIWSELSILDNDISFKFNEEEYIDVVKKWRNQFNEFYSTTITLDEEERKKYIDKFTHLLKNLNNEPARELKDSTSRSLFAKDKLDMFDTETYLGLTTEQCMLIENSIITDLKDNKDFVSRLNRLMQNNNFHSKFCNYNFMFERFSDEELLKMDYGESSIFREFSKNEKDWERIMDLYQRAPEIIRECWFLLSPYNLNQISNDALIEFTNKYGIENLQICCNSCNNNAYLKAKTRPYEVKALVKRLLKKPIQKNN